MPRRAASQTHRGSARTPIKENKPLQILSVFCRECKVKGGGAREGTRRNYTVNSVCRTNRRTDGNYERRGAGARRAGAGRGGAGLGERGVKEGSSTEQSEVRLGFVTLGKIGTLAQWRAEGSEVR